jgi:Uncharacterised nucleotidyltransferase
MTELDQLTPHQCDVLSVLADPEASASQTNALSAFSAADLFAVAQMHGVSHLVYRKIKASDASTSADVSKVLEIEREAYRIQSAVMLDLSFRGDELSKALTGANIDHRTVKGLKFATDLYDNQNDRPYTDIDIVLPLEHLGNATQIGKDLGYIPAEKLVLDHSQSNQEIKLLRPNAPHILIELHGNLVHMRALRRVKKIGWPELSLAYDWTSPFVGHFIIAVTHASLGHKFHNLKLMVDCLQALRRLRPDDLPYLGQMVRSFNLELEVATVLNLCSAIFVDKKIKEKAGLMASQLKLPSPFRLIRAEDVLQAPFKLSAQSRWRRRAFRLYQLV